MYLRGTNNKTRIKAMKINVSLSKKQNEQGKCTILLLIRRRSAVGKVVDVRAKVALEFDPSKFNKECNTFDKYRNGKINPEDVS